ncbi:MAG TPA: H-X9-DG-CTERM domain-containing protein [Pyrinomonadaceae bacterium]|nr:H-X9-DG-CTERM domain-containing protein [Pyrinomonadaceae bacterium]
MDEDTAKRINIDDLAKPEQELSDDDEKNVTGGYSGGVNVAMGDGSVRFVSGGISGNTVGGVLSPDDSKKSG